MNIYPSKNNKVSKIIKNTNILIHFILRSYITVTRKIPGLSLFMVVEQDTTTCSEKKESLQ